jgi:hypothetical protein
MTICTFTAAIVSTYFLASTWMLSSLLEPIEHPSLIRYFNETIFNIGKRIYSFACLDIYILFLLQELSSMKSTTISSGGIAVLLITYHLFMSIKNYKRHKLQLLKGIYKDIPSPESFQLGTIQSNYIRYCGFFIGHTVCSWIVYYYLIFFILNIIQLLFLPIPSIQSLLSIIVSVLVIYLLAMTYIQCHANLCFAENINRKIGGIFMYFIFLVGKICSMKANMKRISFV